MNRVQLVLRASLFISFTSISISRAQTIANWSFENGPLITGSGTNISGLLPEIGSGTASGVHATASTWRSPTGNGSLHSFAAFNWASGDYFQFEVSTLGVSGISVAWDQTSSATGPRNFDLAWSSDGELFTRVSSYTVAENGGPNSPWNMTTVNGAYSYSYNLSSYTGLNNQVSVFFRLVNRSNASVTGGIVDSAGASLIDNFTVVPEPRSWFLFSGIGVLVWMFFLQPSRIRVGCEIATMSLDRSHRERGQGDADGVN